MHENDRLERLLESLPVPHPHRRIGRNAAQITILLRALMLGHTATAAASLAGLSGTTVKRWRKIDPAFRVQFEEARSAGRTALAQRRIEAGLAA